MPSKFNPTPKDCLSYEQVAKELRYDPEIGHLFWLERKSRRDVTQPAGCLNHDGYRRVCVLGVTFQAHRLAWLLHYRQWPSMMIDHINGAKDDNRIVNLREVTRSQNIQNKLIKKKGKALPGTHFRKRSGKYESVITANGKVIWLGCYATEIEAHNAYLEGVKKHHVNYRIYSIDKKIYSYKYRFKVVKKSGSFFVNEYMLAKSKTLAKFHQEENAIIFLETMKKIQNMVDMGKFHVGL